MQKAIFRFHDLRICYGSDSEEDWFLLKNIDSACKRIYAWAKGSPGRAKVVWSFQGWIPSMEHPSVYWLPGSLTTLKLLQIVVFLKKNLGIPAALACGTPQCKGQKGRWGADDGSMQPSVQARKAAPEYT